MRPGERTRVIYAFGEYRLDTDRLELWRGDQAVAIEPQVFRLLQHLIENRARVVGKEELIDQVWGGRIVSDATLSSRINAARRAVGDSGQDQAVIRTTVRRGFRFVAAVEIAEAEAGRPASEGRRLPAEGYAGEHSGRPSIAVLPFANLGGDADEDFLADGIAEDLITLLSRIRWLFVTARNSAFTYKSKTIEAARVSRELGVRYIVEGSVRREGKRARISAQLVDAQSGHCLWAERYDRELCSLFDLQDEIAMTIATAIEPELGLAEREPTKRKPPESLNAWESFQRGLRYLFHFTEQDNIRAKTLFEAAIAMDPGFAAAQAYLGYSHFLDVMFDYAQLRDQSLARAKEAALQAVKIDQREPLGHTILGRALAAQRDYEAGKSELETALRLSPNLLHAHYGLAVAHIWSGQPADAMPGLEMARSLSPHDLFLWSIEFYMACALIAMGDHAAAVSEARKAIQRPNATFWPQASLVSALGHLGQLDHARLELEKLYARKPDFPEFFRERASFWLAEAYRPFAAGLQKAGICEH